MMGEASLPESRARLELYVRSSAPSVARERQTATVERLRALDTGERIESVAVRTWQKRIPIGERARPAGETHRTYTAFEDWARAHGAELRPFFDTRECHSPITGESHTALVLPVMCLAVYEGDRLRSVFPHASDGRTYAVGDALDALETDGGNRSRRSTVSPA